MPFLFRGGFAVSHGIKSSRILFAPSKLRGSYTWSPRGAEKCRGIWSIFGHFSPIYPRSFHHRPLYSPAVFRHADTFRRI